jgi:hypothetical protein
LIVRVTIRGIDRMEICNMTDVYIGSERFERIAEAIAALEPCPFFGVLTADQVKMALGEHGDIWPDSIRRHIASAQ